MPSPEKLSKHTLNLYDGDFERLQDLYPDIGASVIIRKLVRERINKAQVDTSAITVEDLR